MTLLLHQICTYYRGTFLVSETTQRIVSHMQFLSEDESVQVLATQVQTTAEPSGCLPTFGRSRIR